MILVEDEVILKPKVDFADPSDKNRVFLTRFVPDCKCLIVFTYLFYTQSYMPLYKVRRKAIKRLAGMQVQDYNIFFVWCNKQEI